MKTRPHSDEYKKVLMTDEEYQAFVEYHFVVDDVSGEIVADRLTPYQAAGIRRSDWEPSEVFEEEYDKSMLTLPKSFTEHKNKKTVDLER